MPVVTTPRIKINQPGRPQMRPRLLSREQEVGLFKQIEAGGSAAKKAIDTIIKSNQGLIHSIAQKYTGCGVDYADLIQEGNIGLLKAAEKFDHTRGYKFATYATWWIRQAISRAVKNTGRTIRLPDHVHSEVRELIKIREQIKQDSGNYPTHEELAKITDYSLDKIKRLLSAPKGQCLSLSTPAYRNEEGGPSLIERIAGSTPSPEDLLHSKNILQLLQQYLNALEPRERTVLELRIYSEKKLEEIGDILGCVSENVRLIEKKAIEKLIELHDITQSVGSRTARQLKTLYKWRIAIRKAAQKTMAKDLGRPLALQDIRAEVKANGKKGLNRSTFFQIQKNDPAIRQIVSAAIETSWQQLLAKAISQARQGLADNQLTPVNKTARLAGINVSTLIDIRKKRPHLLPPDVEFKTALRDESLKNYTVDRLQKLSTSVNDSEVSAPRTFEELASLLGIWPTTLAEWREAFPKEIGPLVEELLNGAVKTPNGNRRSPKALARQAARLKKLETAARDYQQVNPGKLIPVNVMMGVTRIPENTLLKLMQENKDHLKSQGLRFRSSKRGAQKEAYVLARIEKIRQEVEAEKVAAPKDKTELCNRLSVSRNTIFNWERSSEKARKAIAELIALNENLTGRLHRRDQLPVEQRPTLFAQGYSSLATPKRDLGRNPVRVSELAAEVAYTNTTLINWITDSSEIIGETFVLYLKQGYPRELIMEQRRRRVNWAIEFARSSGFNYLSLAEFSQQRLNVSWQSFRKWLKDDLALVELFEEEANKSLIGQAA